MNDLIYGLAKSISMIMSAVFVSSIIINISMRSFIDNGRMSIEFIQRGIENNSFRTYKIMGNEYASSPNTELAIIYTNHINMMNYVIINNKIDDCVFVMSEDLVIRKGCNISSAFYWLIKMIVKKRCMDWFKDSICQ